MEICQVVLVVAGSGSSTTSISRNEVDGLSQLLTNLLACVKSPTSVALVSDANGNLSMCLS
jgi:hypothetical protein